jgi:autotransporter-associated beta strand protein
MFPLKGRYLLFSLLVCLQTFEVSKPIFADTLTWNNTGTDFNAVGSWTNTTNINQGRVPTFTDVATFSVSEINNPSVTAIATTPVLGINFGIAGIGYTISSASANAFLAVGSSGISASNTAGTNNITASLLLNFDQSITQAAGGTLNITGPARLGGGIGTTTITIGTTSGNGTINFAPSSAEIGNDIAFVTHVNATLPTVVSETPGAGILKSGAATLTMTGASSYDGATTINAGTLLANNGSGSATGTAAVSVNNSGTLGGTGTISGAIIINSGGRITGADAGSIGALTLQSNVTFSGASGNLATYFVDIGVGANNSDRLTVGGSLSLTDSFDQILFNGTPDGTSNYILATATGGITGTFDSGTAPAGYQFVYGANEIDLVAVPEPSTWVGGFLAVGLVCWKFLRNGREAGTPKSNGISLVRLGLVLLRER